MPRFVIGADSGRFWPGDSGSTWDFCEFLLGGARVILGPPRGLEENS